MYHSYFYLYYFDKVMVILQKKFFLLLSLFLFVIAVSAQQTEDAVTTVEINAVGGLQYDLVRFKVKPGATIKIVLNNNDDMSHNLVITAPEAREEVVNAALKLGARGMEMDYVPRVKNVLWFVKILSPGETASVTFTAPKEAGVYPYVCTYPGHGYVMFGAMYVTDEALPDIKNDLNIPERNRIAEGTKDGDKHTGHSKQMTKPPHPYPLTPPYLYRTFMPDAGPAAIAVNLPHSLSYCWDAGTCRLRYAWQGDFLDNTDVWKGHKDAYSKILGTVFFRDKTAFPLHIESPENIPAVKFKGYRLINGYPEFHYLISGMDVYELLQSKADGTGLTRTFKIPKTGKIIWFDFKPGDGVTYTSSDGEWVSGKLKLSPGQAREFMITMTKK